MVLYPHYLLESKDNRAQVILTGSQLRVYKQNGIDEADVVGRLNLFNGKNGAGFDGWCPITPLQSLTNLIRYNKILLSVKLLSSMVSKVTWHANVQNLFVCGVFLA